MWLDKSDKKAQNPDLADLAYKHEDSRAKVLVYVRSPEDAVKIASDLGKRIKDKSGERVALLTGTIRGFERDRLVAKDAVYQQMLNPESKPSETVYLVSTSAGEVGIDIDADHMVCDLVPLDSMIQRLGRVNRRGGHQREAQVDVLWIEEQVTRRPSEFEKAAAKTLEILRRWEEGSDGSLNVSPRNVRDMIDSLSSEDRADAFSPKPEIREVTDILLDAWSLTSVDDMPGRPEVAPYLHGDVPDLPETYVAWRREIGLFGEHSSDDVTVSEWFRICPIRSSERVREQPDKVKVFLRRLLNEHRKKDESSDFPVVMQNNHGRAERLPLSEILGSNDRQLLNYKTLVLPIEVGGLSEQGVLDSKITDPVGNIDVADQIVGESKRKRIFPGDSCPSGWKERGNVILREAREGSEEKEPERRLSLVMHGHDVAVDDHELSRFNQTLKVHTSSIVSNVADIGKRIDLKPEIASALALACEWHDKGKDRDVWQRYARKSDCGETYAKSMDYLHGRALAGYRHELGSLLDAMRDEAVKGHAERDLILHLIASHHGRARPHFGPTAFDKERYTTRENFKAINEAMRRFGRLQNRYGRWGLAWLEALMRCADIAASQPPGGFEEPSVDEEPCEHGAQM